MEFKPLYDNIHIRLEEEETTLQTTDPLFTENGVVVAVGEDVKNIQAGETLAIFKFGVKTAVRNGIKYHTIRNLPAFIQGKYN